MAVATNNATVNLYSHFNYFNIYIDSITLTQFLQAGLLKTYHCFFFRKDIFVIVLSKNKNNEFFMIEKTLLMQLSL